MLYHKMERGKYQKRRTPNLFEIFYLWKW